MFFCVNSFALADENHCSSNMQTWWRSPYPSNSLSEYACRSHDQGSGWYDNQDEPSPGGNLFLAMIGIQWSPCNSSNVASIQSKMQQIWWACSTCKDGRAWYHTRNAMSQCVTMLCTWDLVTPVLNGWNLSCSLPDYSLVDHSAFWLTYQCCQENEIPYEPVPPTITNTNPEWEGGVAHIEVRYTDTAEVVSWDSNANVFNVSDWSISNIDTNTSSMIVTFDVTDIWDDVNSINVNIWDWLIIFEWSVLSRWWSQTFSRDSNCPNLPDPETHECPQQWYVVWEGWCCVPPCTWNQYLASWGCTDCTWDTIPNDNHTKCVCNPDITCCWIKLNTVVPFIWDCIEMNASSSRWDTTSVTSVTAFPVLMQWLMKILMSAIMIFSFLMVIIAWFMMTTAGFWWSGGFTKWKTILKNVIISLILLWCSWLILSLINPNFFGG